jgi:hypothetical protein
MFPIIYAMSMLLANPELLWALYPFIYKKLPDSVNTLILYIPTVIYGFKLAKRLYAHHISVIPTKEELSEFEDLLSEHT